MALLTWDYRSRVNCLKGFQVWRSDELDGNYVILNENQLGIVLFHHLREAKKGWYKIRAIDFWDREGPFSAPYFLTHE